MPLPADAKERKRIPLHSGVMGYFPDALIEVAKVSWAGNEQHNPGQPLHWAREKSTDHEDCIARHTYDAMTSEGAERITHLASRAWRALAALQLAVEGFPTGYQSKPKVYKFGPKCSAATCPCQVDDRYGP
jgi:hypothetical protein